MAQSSQRDIDVKVLPDIKFGQFANAFRVVEEVGTDCFLDFMVFSVQANEAIVVARVRVCRDFLPQIRETMQEAVVQFEQNSCSSIENIVFQDDEKTVH